MSLRVTPNLSVAQFLSRLTQQNGAIAKLQDQASSGLKIRRPSDDPAGLRSILRAEDAIQRLQTRSDTVAAARYRLEQTNVAVRQVQTLFSQAEALASQAVQAIEPAEREVIADEIDGILRQLDALANLEVSGEYLFSGIATERVPFPNAATAANVVYEGSDIPRTMQLHSGPPSVILASGAEVFQPIARQQTLFLGETGAAAGAATDSARGRSTLLVTHTLTEYAAGSGVTAGADSATGDTILGPAGTHRLTINDTSGTGAFGTISLNGGPEVAFANTDTNLVVTGPSGEKVYLNTTAVAAGFTGDIDITAHGALSTDGGATTTAIDFSSNQAVTDSVTGQITNVDSTGIRAVGSEHLEYIGTADAFAALRELRDDIRNTRGLTEGEQRNAIARRIPDLQRVHDHLLDVVGEQSVTLSQLDDVQTHAQDAQLEFKKHVADLASADIAQVALELQQARNQLQYTMATASGLFELSLLDFLR